MKDNLGLGLLFTVVGSIIALGVYGFKNYKPPEPIVFTDEDEQDFWEECVNNYLTSHKKCHRHDHFSGLDHFQPTAEMAKRYADILLRARRERIEKFQNDRGTV